MSTNASTSLNSRNSLLRSIALGGMIVFIGQLTQVWLVNSLFQNTPFILVLQYLASGALGNTAFEGGIATALLGVFFHLLVSFVVAGVFILSADRIPLLRRHAIPGALVYGFGVYLVMNWIVLPLSKAPPLPPPTMPQLIAMIVDHLLVIGLPLGIIVRRNANHQ